VVKIVNINTVYFVNGSEAVEVFKFPSTHSSKTHDPCPAALYTKRYSPLNNLYLYRCKNISRALPHELLKPSDEMCSE
jgi:hypothetical protein